jgi:hypothetical protein
MRPLRGLTIPIVLLVALAMTYYHLEVFIPHAIARHAAEGLAGGYAFGDDFYPIWLTSREALLHHRNPYSQEMTRDIQSGLFGHPLQARRPEDPAARYREFAYPAYVDLLFWPLALPPFAVVRMALAIVLAAITGFCIPLWMRALRLAASRRFFAIALLLTISSYAVLEGVFAVQPGLLVAFLLAAVFAAFVKNRLFLAGSLFAFTFIKPQMSALVAAYLLLWTVSRWRERRGFVLGLATWSAVLVIPSLIVWPHWIRDWLRVLSGYGSYSPPPLITYSLGPGLGPHLGPPLIVVLLAAALLLAWRMRKTDAASASFALTISTLFALTSITLLPGQAVYDHVILLPGVLWIACKWRGTAASLPFRVILVISAVLVFWQWIIVFPLLAARPLLSSETFFSRGVWLLPFHAAASVPLAICAVLGYLLATTLGQKHLAGEADPIPVLRA